MADMSDNDQQKLADHIEAVGEAVQMFSNNIRKADRLTGTEFRRARSMARNIVSNLEKSPFVGEDGTAPERTRVYPS